MWVVHATTDLKEPIVEVGCREGFDRGHGGGGILEEVGGETRLQPMRASTRRL